MLVENGFKPLPREGKVRKGEMDCPAIHSFNGRIFIFDCPVRWRLLYKGSVF